MQLQLLILKYKLKVAYGVISCHFPFKNNSHFKGPVDIIQHYSTVTAKQALLWKALTQKKNLQQETLAAIDVTTWFYEMQ